MNPMLVKNGAVNVGARKEGEVMAPELESLVKGLIEHEERPETAVWQVFQSAFVQLTASAAEVARDLAAEKEKASRAAL